MHTLTSSGYTWLNGDFLSSDDARIHCLTHGLHYGFGVLEGLRVYATNVGPAIFRLEEHTDRLIASAKILNIPVDFNRSDIIDAQKNLVRKNNLTSCYIRPIIYAKNDDLSLLNKNMGSEFVIATLEQDSNSNLPSKIPTKVKTTTLLRNHSNKLISKAKACGNYLYSILALQEAHASDCNEALFLDDKGFVTEGSGANIFLVKNSVLYTPDTTNILEGITRDTVFTLARDIGLQVIEKKIKKDELLSADEAFFTGTTAEIKPIDEIDGKHIGQSTEPKPITTMLQALYQATVTGNKHEYSHWLSYV